MSAVSNIKGDANLEFANWVIQEENVLRKIATVDRIHRPFECQEARNARNKTPSLLPLFPHKIDKSRKKERQKEKKEVSSLTMHWIGFRCL